ncbi:hypothetical protein AXG93_1842s1050 [Marchantia polymorpha subsp. ruderalis]|uniref:Uncharacterized protein n=1 Tax=Marchantia polymorpha subsp. ruderalis TaxID=1480154 RepID=A0A176WFK9_MARPO|nr:hypothetical protein AXG93_1842s1050 [Marchantia polymorpha subsp. ruderalis]
MSPKSTSIVEPDFSVLERVPVKERRLGDLEIVALSSTAFCSLSSEASGPTSADPFDCDLHLPAPTWHASWSVAYRQHDAWRLCFLQKLYFDPLVEELSVSYKFEVGGENVTTTVPKLILDMEGVHVTKILENPFQRGVQELTKALQVSTAEEYKA